MAVLEEFLKGAAAPVLAFHWCVCTLHPSYTLKTLYFFIPSNSPSDAKDDVALHLQNVATTAPSRFSKVSLYAPSGTRVNFL